MNAHRTRVNGISAFFSVAMILSYLFAPFYSIMLSSISVSGFRLIGLSPITLLPVLLGLVMTLGVCFFPPLIAIIIESLTTLTLLIFMFAGNAIATSFIGNALNLPPEWGIALNTTQSLLPMIQPSWGAIITLLLCIIALVIDVLANISRHSQAAEPYVIGDQGDFSFNDPFSSGF